MLNKFQPESVSSALPPWASFLKNLAITLFEISSKIFILFVKEIVGEQIQPIIYQATAR